MLQKQAIEVPFGVGVNESVQKEILDPNGSMAEAHNLVVAKSGAYTQRDRLTTYGFQVSKGFTVHEYDQRYPVVCDGDRLHDWSTKMGTWVDKGNVSEVVVSRVSGVQPPPSTYIYQFDSVVLNGVRVTILTTPRGVNGGSASDELNANYSDVFYQITDAESDAVIQPVRLLAQMFGPATVGSLAIGTTPDGYAVVFGTETTRNGSNVVTQMRYQAWTFNLANPTAAPVVTVLESSNTPLGIPTTALSPTSRGNSLVLFHTAIGVAEFRIRTFTPSTAATSFVVSPVTDIWATSWGMQNVAILWDAAASVLWMVHRDNLDPPNVRARILSASYAVLASTSLGIQQFSVGFASTVTCALGESTGGVSRDLWVSVSVAIDGGPFSSTQFRRIVRDTASSLVSNSLGAARRGVMAYSDPINRNGRWYQWLQPTPYTAAATAYRSALPALPYLALCEVVDGAQPLRPVANVAPKLLDSVHHSRWPHRVAQTSANTYETPVSVLRNAVTSNLEVVSVNFADTRRMMSAPFGDVLAFSGGSANYYDGTSVSEMGFIAPPNIASTVTSWVSGNPGGKVLPGTYSAFVVWRAVDARGNVHVSDISNILTLVIPSDSTVRIDLHPLLLTARNGGASTQFASVRAVLYTTRLNGSTFYETDDVSSAASGGSLQPAPLYFDFDRNKLFYTQPGVLNAALFRYAPPALRSLIQHNGALCGVAEDGRTIWFSGLHLAGEGPWFHPAFVAYVDDLAPVNALASMDGRLFAFTANGIWTIDGNGFADNGEGGYGPPTRIAADAGCTNERSVVVTPIGILFESELGIALLSRAGQVSWFGRFIEDTLREYGTITSAVLVRPKGEVRFTLTDGAESTWLTWNYVENVWTTGTRQDVDTGPIVHAAMVQRGEDAAWHVLYQGGILAYDNGQGLDYGGQHVETKLSTAWIKVAGLQGFQRMWRALLLFNRNGPAGLRVSLAYDYDETPTEVRTWTDAEVAALPKGAVEIHCRRQKCTAVRVTVEVLAPAEATTGLGLDLLGLRLICGMKGKTPRGKAAR